MKTVTIIGGGIVGVTSAYALQKAGYKVTILDAMHGVAMDTSYANAGELSFGYSGPWATPGLVRQVPGMLCNSHSPLRIHLDTNSLADAHYQARWLYWFLLNTKRSRFERNKARIVDLSSESKRAFHRMYGGLGIEFAARQLGTLQLFRTQSKFDAVVANDVNSLKASGVDFELVDSAGCVKQEPALERIADSLAGGLVFKLDETGDCHAFTCGLAKHFLAAGGEIKFNVRVLSIDADKQGVHGLNTTSGYSPADQVVLACGPRTRALTEPLGLRVPIYPVRGYSMTAPITDVTCAPISTVLDEDSKVAITRLDSRLRVGGTAEIAGFHRHDDLSRRALLAHVASAVFPGSFDDVHGAGKSNWSGFRPMTPDGTPIIGRTACKGLLINAGHGTLGWTQSAASAEHLVHVISGTSPVLDPADYELARYGRRATNHGYFLPAPNPKPAF